MTTINDVLAHIGRRLPHLDMTKALKLAYYSQAWHATWEGHSLYPERTEAWMHGPVCREGYRLLRYGPVPQPRDLSATEAAVVDAVIDFYGHMNGSELGDLAHDEAPWIEARGTLPPEARSDDEITVSSMRRYYTRKAMNGEAVPQRPVVEPSSLSPDEVDKLIDEQMVRWRETLVLLAER